MVDTHVDLSLEFLGGLDGPRNSNNLTSAHLLTLDSTEESTHVITRLTLTRVQGLACTIHRSLTMSILCQGPYGTSLDTGNESKAF